MYICSGYDAPPPLAHSLARGAVRRSISPVSGAPEGGDARLARGQRGLSPRWAGDTATWPHGDMEGHHSREGLALSTAFVPYLQRPWEMKLILILKKEVASCHTT